MVVVYSYNELLCNSYNESTKGTCIQMSKAQKHNEKNEDLCLCKTNVKQTFSYIVYGYK